MSSGNDLPSGTDDAIRHITDLLFCAEPLRQVDVAIVLGSPNTTASDPAIALYRAGLVPWIVVTGRGRGDETATPEWQIHRDHLVAAGVPQDRILIETDATNTFENITLSARLIANRLGWTGIGAVAICCKPLHARRALLTARTHLPTGRSLSVHCPRDPRDIQPDNWWQHPTRLARVMGEVQRIGEYLKKGDLKLPGAPSLQERRHVYLLGIGGSGMSALARLYREAGWIVSGSDRASGAHLAGLQDIGVTLHSEEDAPPDSVTLVVNSHAVPQSHAAIAAADRRGVPVHNRSRALTDLIAGRKVVSVAGSHGKTSTATMLAVILQSAGRQAGHMVGGVSEALAFNARLGTGPLMVAETCEAFRGLDHWQPAHCLLTNVDDEHSEHYGSLGALQAAFGDLVRRVPDGGAVVLWGEDPVLAGLAARRGAGVLTYGLGTGNRVHPVAVTLETEQTEFDLVIDGVTHGRAVLPVPGMHMLRNALGALAMAIALGITPEQAIAGLARFQPVRRRWQEVAAAQGVQVFDDFAHHPAEIAATLAVAQDLTRNTSRPDSVALGRIHAVIAPQMISRVARLADEFAAALAMADQIWTLPLDPAGEVGDCAAATEQLHAALHRIGRHANPVANPGAAALTLCAAVRPGDVVVCMGPAAAAQAAEAIAAGLRAHAVPPAVIASKAKVPAGPPPPQARRLCDRFEGHVAATPDAFCAMFETEGVTARMTYAQLAAEGDRIALALVARGIGPGDLVAVNMAKSLTFLALLLGISRAGAAFVTIDPRMTRAGMGRVLRAGGTRMTLTDDPWRARLAGFDAPMTVDDLLNGPQPFETPDRRHADADDLAYAIFTSGSTGVPRLVGVSHRNVVSYFDQTLGKIYVAEDYRLLPATASISFDASVHQIFCTLSLGGCLLLVEDLAALARSAHLDRITLLGGTPSTLHSFLQSNSLPATVRTVNLGGEPVPPEVLTHLRQSPELRRIWNLYGPAETTMAVLAADLMTEAAGGDAAGGRLIGRPFGQVRLRVADTEGKDVAPGTAGELLIGGPTVGQGYLGAPELTEARFFTDPEHPDLRWYRSGDIVRQRPDQAFLFLGRDDDQVKINGARIETGEVRAALMGCPGVRDAAVLAVAEGAGDDGRKRLAGFVVLEPGTDIAFLRGWLRQRHAPILVPHQIVALDRLPLQVNGKIDRQALLSIAGSVRRQDTAESVDGQPDTANPADAVLTIWREALRCADLRSNENFHEAGGDSLAAMEIVLAVEARFATRLPAAMTDRLSTVAQMTADLLAHLATRHDQPASADSDIWHRQRIHIAAWAGERRRPESLLRTLNPGQDDALFWIFQGNAEFTALANTMAPQGGLPGVTLHAMRSGHRVMDYNPDTLSTMADAYAAEIMDLAPTRPIRIGGNCQGATIARAVAFALRAQGHDVSQLILMELGRPWKYDAMVDLIYGEDSALNPYRNGADATATIAAAYPAGFRTHFITGRHGQFFEPTHVPSLARVLRGILATQGNAP